MPPPIYVYPPSPLENQPYTLAVAGEGEEAMASEGLRRCVFDGSIPAIDSEIHNRPYHKNCSCALHQRPGKCKKECNHGKTSISYKTRKAWSESCLVATSGCWSTSNFPLKKVVWES